MSFTNDLDEFRHPLTLALDKCVHIPDKILQLLLSFSRMDYINPMIYLDESKSQKI